MSLFDTALSFIEGIKSVIDFSGAAQGAISDSVSDGIESAFRRIRKPMERSLVKVALIVASLMFIAGGAALLLENFVPYHGLGFVAVGAFIGIVALLFLQEKETG